MPSRLQSVSPLPRSRPLSPALPSPLLRLTLGLLLLLLGPAVAHGSAVVDLGDITALATSQAEPGHLDGTAEAVQTYQFTLTATQAVTLGLRLAARRRRPVSGGGRRHAAARQRAAGAGGGMDSGRAAGRGVCRAGRGAGGGRDPLHPPLRGGRAAPWGPRHAPGSLQRAESPVSARPWGPRHAPGHLLRRGGGIYERVDARHAGRGRGVGRYHRPRRPGLAERRDLIRA